MMEKDFNLSYLLCILRKFTASLFFLGLFVACSNDDDSNGSVEPFSNGTNERNLIFVISDLHLGADLVYAECKENLASLELFLKEVGKSPNIKELVIAGDMLDEWFVPANIDTYNGKDQLDFVQRIATANKGVITALNQIIRENKIKVTYVPGNHDLTITAANVDKILPKINQARDTQLGLGTYSPIPEIAIEHGHRYNFFCAPDPISNQDLAPGTIMPPGYFFTRIAALHVAQKCTELGDVLPIVVPNSSGSESQNLLYTYWGVWAKTIKTYPIKNKLDEKIIVTNMDGFTGNYSANDVFPYQTIAGGMIAVKLYNGIQDTWQQRENINGVAVHIPTMDAIKNAGASTGTDVQAQAQYFSNPKSDVRIVVFGHSHVPLINSSTNHNGDKSIYANAGTWIDHNTLAPTKMNFVVITPQGTAGSTQTTVKLYNFENNVANIMNADSLKLQ